MNKSVLAVLTALTVAALPSLAQAKTQLSTVTGAPIVTQPGDPSVTTMGGNGRVTCPDLGEAIAVGWAGDGAFVSDTRIEAILGYATLTLAASPTGAPASITPVALCAKMRFNSVTPMTTSPVSPRGRITSDCGRRRITLGVSTPTGFYAQTAAAYSKPLASGKWATNLGDIPYSAEAVCIKPSAFKAVKRARASKAFAVGQVTTDVTVGCPKRSVPIGWGYDAPVMDGNADATGQRKVPFIRSSLPTGTNAWTVTFQTADSRPATSGPKLTAWAVCARPR